MSAELFFYRHAGYAFDPKLETKEQGRRRCARMLAEAEKWLNCNPTGLIEWMPDHNPDWSGISHQTELFVCRVSIGCPCGHHACAGRWTESLFNIDFGPIPSGRDEPPDDDPYKRVVAAELAAQLHGRYLAKFGEKK